VVKRTKDTSAGIVPVRCDECYLRTELLRLSGSWAVSWPEKAPSCLHPPILSCPSMKAAVARARASTDDLGA
jgi:hypothetical protein